MLPFQTAKRHVTNVNKLAKIFALSGWTQIAVMFKILKGNAPSYLRSLFSVRTLEYDVRNNQSIKLHIPKPRTNYLKRSICYSGALLWHNLPQEIRNLPNLSQFKRTNDCYVDT